MNFSKIKMMFFDFDDGDFPYNVYDANGGIVKPETKKAKKVV